MRREKSKEQNQENTKQKIPNKNLQCKRFFFYYFIFFHPAAEEIMCAGERRSFSFASVAVSSTLTNTRNIKQEQWHCMGEIAEHKTE